MPPKVYQFDLRVAASRGTGGSVGNHACQIAADILSHPTRDAAIGRAPAQTRRRNRHGTLSAVSMALIVDHDLHAVVLVDSAGLIVRANEHFERMCGFAHGELDGRPIEVVVPDQHQIGHSALRQRYFASPSARPMGAGRELWARRRDGSEIPVEIFLTPIHTNGDLFVLASVVDISARVSSREDEQKRIAECAHSARMNAVGQLFVELAHELHQPLSAAANYARATARMIESSESCELQRPGDWIHKAAQQSERAMEIVRRTGNFIKRDGPTRARSM